METFCPECHNDTFAVTNKSETFEYGERPLTVTVPVHTCTKCGYQFTDHIAEDIREQAVQDYINR